MKQHELEEQYQLLCAVYHSAGRRVPWLYRVWYRRSLAFLDAA
jgi:hypothetical protein